MKTLYCTLAQLLIAILLLCGQSLKGESANLSPAKQPQSFVKHTLSPGLIMAGYQGWFNTPDDGAGRGWYHYSKEGKFEPGYAKVDMWPEMDEYEKAYQTAFRFADGTPASTFSSFDESTVRLHFRWMQSYGIDGVYLQRFVAEIKTESGRKHFNKVMTSAAKAALDYDRTLAVMYDMSGMRSEDTNVIIADWKALMAQFGFTQRSRYANYLHHGNRPVVAIWGVGFNDNRRYNLADIEKLIRFFQSDEGGNCSVMLGVPTYWRQQGNDCIKDPRFLEVVKMANIVHPWFVGRFNENGYNAFQPLIGEDLKWCNAHNLAYIPVVFPGFSWNNMYPDSKNSFVARNQGNFFWKQLAGAAAEGAGMVYVAMFDEIDEGTAIFKCAHTVPAGGGSRFVPLDAEIRSDHYLWLTGKAGELLKKRKTLPKSKPAQNEIAQNEIAQPDSLSAGQLFAQRFNPVKGMVHETEKPYRDELCLNGQWQFMPIYENSIDQFVKPSTFRWDSVSIKIPSPWNVNGFSKGDGGDFRVFPSYPEAWEEAKMGWMKKTFSLPETWKGKRIVLHFEAIAGLAKIYVNGQLAGEHLDIFFPCKLDITSLVKKGDNEIIVGVAKASLTDIPGKYGRRNYVAGSFWGQHIAGIWQDVNLLALPELSVSDLYVQPNVQANQLTFSVTVKNHSLTAQTFSLEASVKRWGKTHLSATLSAPEEGGTLYEEVMKMKMPERVTLPSGDSIVLHMSQKVAGNLQYWTPETPNLYGAVVRLISGRKEISDVKYSRFGWRQFSIKGTDLLLNGKPILLKGDSWHFMGVAQMTRRYAWGWFRMLKEANANAVRLHAQPYPSFYLDVADEMGICVLDETAIWSSDGGPKVDSEAYWRECKKHVANLVLRDRNHPSVFGWSVCNETLPVVVHVLHAPDSIAQRQVDEINQWIKIVEALDSTRTWISGDGEEMRPTRLPTVIGHYGDEGSMKNWSSQGKPWGIGETGMAYYGTPKQVSAMNGNRAYESQSGRMEGLAKEAYQLIGKQQLYKAVYSSVFNLVWYGLKPLELGLRDTTKAPTLSDGIFFSDFQEGLPGMQPERLGPYSTTLNPGYDPLLPLYSPWPLFHAVQAINATPVQPFSVVTSEVRTSPPFEANVTEVGLIAQKESRLREWLSRLGVPIVETGFSGKSRVILVDGSSLNDDPAARQQIDSCLKAGGRVLVWSPSPEYLPQLRRLLPFELILTRREATSFIRKKSDRLIGTLDNKDFYFSELTQKPVMKYGLSGEIVQRGEVILEACNTNWNRWNGQGENIKTASVLRSERESKPDGAALLRLSFGTGQLYLFAIDLLPLQAEGEAIGKTLLRNLGIVLQENSFKSQRALSEEGWLERALLMEGNGKEDNAIELMEASAQGRLDLTAAAARLHQLQKSSNELFLSFWIYSPRSLVNLLVEPDIPTLSMIIEGNLKKSVYINGSFFAKAQSDDDGLFKNLPFERGWNHVVVCIERDNELAWQSTRIGFRSNNPTYLARITSSVGQEDQPK